MRSRAGARLACATRSPACPPGRRPRLASSPTTPARSLGVLGLLLIAQLAARDRWPGPRPAAAARGRRAVLAGAIAANVLVVGAALGGYGTRMVRAMLPHGPVELAAYALALALYLQGRRRALPDPHAGGSIAASVALLAARRALETL